MFVLCVYWIALIERRKSDFYSTKVFTYKMSLFEDFALEGFIITEMDNLLARK